MPLLWRVRRLDVLMGGWCRLGRESIVAMKHGRVLRMDLLLSPQPWLNSVSLSLQAPWRAKVAMLLRRLAKLKYGTLNVLLR